MNRISRAHLNHFGGVDKTLFRVNGQKERKPSIRTRGAGLRSTGGFTFIMKRMSRCSYLIDQNQNRSIENGESGGPTALSAISEDD